VTLILTLLLSLVVIGGVVVVAFLSVSWGREGSAPQGRPVWMGPDASEVERMVTRAVGLLRADAGMAECEPHPAALELARVHAFDMATRGFGGEKDPEGRDLGARSAQLFPDLKGDLRSWQLLTQPEPDEVAERIAFRLTDGDKRLAELVQDERWNALAAGAAVEEGRCAVCVVAGRIEPPEKREGLLPDAIEDL